MLHLRKDCGKELTSSLESSIILDTDVASAFAKIERLGLLLSLFSKHPIFITPRIFEELSVPLEYGYKFPLEIFSRLDVLYPSEDEIVAYQDMFIRNKAIGKGELEAICICKRRGYVFSSMDSAALKLALSIGVEILDLQSILRALWESGIISKDDVKAIIREMEDKDNTTISGWHLIF